MRLRDYLSDNDLNESLQFSYKKHHTCERALLRAQNDMLKSIDNKQCVLRWIKEWGTANLEGGGLF